MTLDEAKLIAGFVNVATGRGDFGRLNEGASHLSSAAPGKLNMHIAVLNSVFFAPRYVLSRFQYMAMPFYLPFKGGVKNNWRVKRAIYAEYGRALRGVGVVMGAIQLASWLLYDDDDEEKPTIEWWDSRSSDWWKVRVGETRFDFMSGLQQPFVFATRFVRGSTKSSTTGEIKEFGDGYNSKNRLTLTQDFARSKLAPVPGAIATAMNDWKNIVGQKETPLSLALGLYKPLAMGDAVDTVAAKGPAKGIPMSLLAILGAGVSTYGPKTQYLTGTATQQKEQFDKELKNMDWDAPPLPPYSEFLTQSQLNQYDARRREKRGQVIVNAMYDGETEERLETKAKNMDYLKAMMAEGVTHEQAQQFLVEHHRKPSSSGKRNTEYVSGTVKLEPSYLQRSRALAELYESDWKKFYHGDEFKSWSKKWFAETR